MIVVKLINRAVTAIFVMNMHQNIRAEDMELTSVMRCGLRQFVR
jgi:hypothetical protein